MGHRFAMTRKTCACSFHVHLLQRATKSGAVLGEGEKKVKILKLNCFKIQMLRFEPWDEYSWLRVWCSIISSLCWDSSLKQLIMDVSKRNGSTSPQRRKKVEQRNPRSTSGSGCISNSKPRKISRSLSVSVFVWLLLVFFGLFVCIPVKWGSQTSTGTEE